MGDRKLRQRMIVSFGKLHGWAYERSDGRVGSRLWRKDMTLLWTTGRKSGQTRRTALLTMPHGDGVVVVASFYGASNHPAWYLNLLADPNCTVRYQRHKFRTRAVTATGEQREELWAKLTDAWPAFLDYAERTDRELPVVVLDPANAGE